MMRAIALCLLLAACSTPVYVDKAKGGPEDAWPNRVVFQVHPAWKQAPPDCIAILPLEAAQGSDPAASDSVRRALYAHLAPQGKRDVELARVDFIARHEPEPARLAERLRCGTLLSGTVTDYRSSFYGVFSRVAVGARLRLVRAADGVILWEGEHVATTHGGAMPLSPIGLAMGIADAANNARDEQILSVADDLARRLMGTIPDDRDVVLDDPGPPPPARPRDGLAEGERLAAVGDWEGALAQADKVLAERPDEAAAHFLKGRMLVKAGRLDEAEPAFVRAVALDGRKAAYLDGLGLVNALKGRDDRALAAWQMAVAVDPADGFAWFNSGRLLANAGAGKDAADSFYGAGLAYLKTGDYGQAGKALAELKDLREAGLALDAEIATIEDALASLPRRKTDV